MEIFERYLLLPTHMVRDFLYRNDGANESYCWRNKIREKHPVKKLWNTSGVGNGLSNPFDSGVVVI